MKKTLLLTVFITSCSYSAQSHAMMGRHAQRVRVLKQIKRACSTQTPAPKSGGSFWKVLISYTIGALTTHVLYEKEVGEEIKKYGTLECPYKQAREKVQTLLNDTKPEDVPQP